MFPSRIQKIQEYLKNHRIQGILISNFYHIAYFSGFRGVNPVEQEAALYISQEEAILYLPLLYELEGKNLETIKQGIARLEINRDKNRLMTLFTKKTNSNGPILFESDDLKVDDFKNISKKLTTKLIPCKNLIHKIKIIKDKEEIQKIQKAARITDQIFNSVKKFLEQISYTNLTELDLAEKMRLMARDLGVYEFSFKPIIASGTGSALPHYHSTNKKLEKNSPLLMDFGVIYQGYCSDLTRNLFLGKANNEYRHAYKIVKKCNEQSIKKCAPKVKSSDLFNQADIYLKQKSKQKLIHVLGHGLGQEVHEPPYLRAGGKDILQPNMITTIEPGLYYENKFGIRIEDLVRITETGREVLSKHSSKELIEII